MGKKKLDVMAKEREVFINGQVDENGNIIVPGCVRNGIDAESANKIFDEMAEFAKYAFNKSHAACYAVVAYRTAYLKAYYPAEFMAATLNSFLGNLDKIPQYIDECKKLGIEILKPEINKSSTKFTVENGKIRFGLGSIKNVGTVPVDNIVKERRKNGPYKSFTDFCERIADEAVNKKCIESLIKAGAFDEFDKTRNTLLASFENIIDVIQSGKKKEMNGQVSMFDLGTESQKEELNEMKYTFEEHEEMPKKELLSLEKEMLGIYISGHPLEKLREQILRNTNITSMDIKELDEQILDSLKDPEMGKLGSKLKYKDGQYIKYAGIITAIKKKYTKSNRIMAFITVEDLYGTVEMICFENAYLKAGKSLIEENIVLVEGRLSIREEENTTIIVNNIQDFAEQKQKILTLNITDSSEEEKDKLRGALRYFNGDKNNINVQIKIGEEIRPCGQVYLTDQILEIFKEILGNENAIVIEN